MKSSLVFAGLATATVLASSSNIRQGILNQGSTQIQVETTETVEGGTSNLIGTDLPILVLKVKSTELKASGTNIGSSKSGKKKKKSMCTLL